MENCFLNFIEDVRIRNLSSNTIEAYGRDLNKFSEFIKERGIDVRDVDSTILMSYVQQLTKVGQASSSIVRSLVVIRNFYRYLARQGYVNNNPVNEYELPKATRSIPQILTVQEVDLLLSKPDLNSTKGLRDKAMLELMYATGIKVTEMLNLATDEVNIKLDYVKCKGIKGKERIIPLGSCAKTHIENYLKVRNTLNGNCLDNLFLNSQGERMTRQGFWKIIKHYSKMAKIEKEINLYTLRHSFAVHLLQNGADMQSVQELLGYSDISAIQMYLNITSRNKLVEVYKNSHPRA